MPLWIPGTPRHVRLALTFGLATICLNLIRLPVLIWSPNSIFTRFQDNHRIESIACFSIAFLFLLVFKLFILFHISRRKNWARNLWLAVFILELPSSTHSILTHPGHTPFITLLVLFTGIYVVYASYFGEGRSWFKKKNTRRTSQHRLTRPVFSPRNLKHAACLLIAGISMYSYWLINKDVLMSGVIAFGAFAIIAILVWIWVTPVAAATVSICSLAYLIRAYDTLGFTVTVLGTALAWGCLHQYLSSNNQRASLKKDQPSLRIFNMVIKTTNPYWDREHESKNTPITNFLGLVIVAIIWAIAGTRLADEIRNSLPRYVDLRNKAEESYNKAAARCQFKGIVISNNDSVERPEPARPATEAYIITDADGIDHYFVMYACSANPVSEQGAAWWARAIGYGLLNAKGEELNNIWERIDKSPDHDLMRSKLSPYDKIAIGKLSGNTKMFIWEKGEPPLVYANLHMINIAFRGEPETINGIKQYSICIPYQP